MTVSEPERPFGERLTWPSPRQRRGRDEEDRLPLDEIPQPAVDPLVLLAPLPMISNLEI
jgi:hypothetical protein